MHRAAMKVESVDQPRSDTVSVKIQACKSELLGFSQWEMNFMVLRVGVGQALGPTGSCHHVAAFENCYPKRDSPARGQSSRLHSASDLMAVYSKNEPSTLSKKFQCHQLRDRLLELRFPFFPDLSDKFGSGLQCGITGSPSCRSSLCSFAFSHVLKGLKLPDQLFKVPSYRRCHDLHCLDYSIGID
jgi:hypothetical protein